MPKLQNRAVKRGDKVYSKYWVTIPPSIIDALRWSDVEELRFELYEGKLLVLPVKWKEKKK